MRLLLAGLGLPLFAGLLAAQPSGHWPPDSLVNVQVIPRNTPVIQVVGTMRNIAIGLGVRCQFCHVGEEVTCATCHRGVSRPVPLFNVIQDAATAGGADFALRAYRVLRERYYGRDSYDFGEASLNIAAFRLGRAGKFAEAFALLRLNEENFPGSSGMYVFRGNLELMRGDTSAAEAAFREAIRRDTTNAEARGRLRDIGKRP